MALIIADRVKETSSANGAGNITLSGAVTGFQSFSSAIGIGNTCYYVIENPNADEWEVGIGTISDATTLVRTTILKSSNSNSVVTFTSGTKNVFVSFPADQIADLATLDGIESLTNKTLSTNTTWNGNVITGQYGGTGVANTGKTITIGGNLTTSGAFTTTIASTANTSVTLPTTGTLATLAGSETFTNKTLSTNTTWNGNVIAGQYGGTGVANTGKTITIGGNLTTSGAFTTTIASTANTSVTLPTTGTLATLAGSETLTNKTLSTNVDYNGNIVAGQYGGTGVANTGKTITIGGNLTTSGAFTTTLTATANTSVTLPTTGTLATLAGTESLSNKYITTSAGNTTVAGLKLTSGTNTTAVANGSIEFDNVNFYFSVAGARKVNAYLDSNLTGTWSGTTIAGQYGGTGVANTGKTITVGGNLTTSGAFTTTLTSTANTSITLPTTGTLATLAGSETLTNKTLSTNIDYNGNVVTGQYGGTGVANTGKTITIGGNLTTSGSFTTTLTATANTSITLPTTGTLSTLAGTESLSNKYITTGAGNTTVAGLKLTSGTNTTAVANGSIEFDNTNYYFSLAGARKTVAYLDSNLTGTWSGTVVAGQYGGTGVANTGKTITIGGNLTTSGAFTTTLTSTANTSVTLPTTGTLATLAGGETITNKIFSTNTTWNGNVIPGQYGGTGIANTGFTLTMAGNVSHAGAFTQTLTATANTSITLPTTGTLATLAGTESLSNKYITTSAGNTTVAGLKLTSGTNTTAVANGSIEFDNTNYYFSLAGARKTVAYLDSNLTGIWSGTVVAGQYGGTGVANTGKTITIGGNLTTSGAFTTTLTSTANTSVTLPTAGTLATLAGPETLTNKTLSTNTTWNGNVIPGQYGGTGIANTGFTLTMAGNISHAGAFAQTFTATGTTSVTLPTAGTLATLAGSETFTNKTLSTNTTWNGNVVTGQYGGTGVANTGKTITIGGNLTTSGAFTTTLTATANTSVTLPTTGTLATLAGSESFTNKTLSTNTTWNGNVIAGQYGGTGIANTGKTITIGGNLTTSGAFTTTITATANTSVTLPTTGTLATLAGIESFTNKTMSTNTTWSGNVITGQYGGTGVANTGKTLTLGGNLTTSGAFATTLISTAATSVTLPTSGILLSSSGAATLTNKILSTNTTWNGSPLDNQFVSFTASSGYLWGFGLNTSGQLADGSATSRSSPVQTISAGVNWKQVSTGHLHSAGIKTDGTLWLWGVNTYGQLGDNSITTRSSPVQSITGGTNWRSVSCGGRNTAAVKDDGTLWVWGDNAYGQVGDNTVTSRSSPVQTIAGGAVWRSASAGAHHILAFKNDGSLWGWGNSGYGQMNLGGVSTGYSSPIQVAVAGVWNQVVSGGPYSAGIKTDGTLWFWGYCEQGQFGNNIASNFITFSQEVTNSTWLAVSIPESSGYYDNLYTVGATAAIKTDGTLWTWGGNSYGQLGDNTVVNRSSPVQTIAGGNNWKQVSVGRSHISAIKTDNTLWAWGNGTATGANNVTNVSSPIQTTAGGYYWESVQAGTSYTIAKAFSPAKIALDGTFITSGAFTTTLTSTANTSVTLPNTGTLATLAGIESFTNKTMSTNTTWNGNVITGQYGGTGVANTGKTITIGGNLTTSGAFTTTLVATANTSVTLPTAGTLATLAGSESFTNKTLSTNTTWNGNVVTGQYGGTGVANTGKTITIGGNLTTSGAFDTTLTATANTSVTLPTTGTLATLSDVESLNEKIESTAGVAWLWGLGVYGELGDNTSNSKSSPVQTVTGGVNWKQASCGWNGTAAIKTDGTLWLWGRNSYGELGDNSIDDKSSPVQTVAGGVNWKQVSFGRAVSNESHTAAVKTDGTLWLWGSNYYGPLGDNTFTNRSSPGQTITGGTNWKQVSCGFQYTAAIKTDGTLWTWGRNDYGQLGDNTTGDKRSPVQTTAGGVNWEHVSCGYSHTAAIKTDGTLWLWGYNFYGSLGDNTSTKRSSPVQTIAGGFNWSQVSCGNIYTAAIKTDGTLWTWGYNSAGQLGNNETSSMSSPVQTVTGGNTWAEISCGDGSSAAIKTDGSLWTWGSNSYSSNGALGDNTEDNRSSPIQTITRGYRWTSVSIGRHAFAIAADIISGDKGGTGVANTDKTITIGGNFTTSGAFTTTLTSTANTSVTLPTTGTLSTVAGGETITNKIFSTNTTWDGNVIPGQYGGTGIANTGKTITIGGNFTTSGAFTTTLTSTANTSVTLPTTGTLATLAGTETFSNKTVNLAAGNATTAPLKFVTGTNMTTAAAGNMEFDGTRLYFSPSTTRQTVAFLTDITGGATIVDDTSTAATRYLVFTSATSGSISTANVSSTKLYFNPSTGDLTAGGNITALSDRTLKSNITTISDALNKVVSLRGVEFDWIESGGHGIGVIAQEVEEVIPEVVLTHMGLKSVAYGNLIAVLIEAIKDQDKRIKLLEALVERFVK
jgi:alpha-tubulin suppressor-like RCC1 family protein